jgi:Ig domain of plant-specific actin-binding protein
MPAVVRSRRSRAGLLALGAAVTLAAALLLSPAGSASTQAAPSNTAQPAISGTAAVGQTLTGSNGTWTENPTSFTYQWVRCAASGGASDGSDCAVIGGATTASYVVGTGDVGFTLRFRVTAVNADGQATAASNATAVVVAQAGPPNTALPTITGTATVGSTLTAAPGTWTGTSVTFAYQWRRCDAQGANCSSITGATQTTYTVASGDVGSTLRVNVTGTNSTGSNTVTSAQTAVVSSAPAPPATGCPSDKSTGPINVSQVSPPAHLVIDRQQARPQPIRRDTQTIVLRFHVSACGGRSIAGALVYQTPTPYQQFSDGEQPTGADGWATLTLRRLRFFPAAQQQQLLVVFVRARKAGEDLLGGISARRLVSFRVNLKAS